MSSDDVPAYPPVANPEHPMPTWPMVFRDLADQLAKQLKIQVIIKEGELASGVSNAKVYYNFRRNCVETLGTWVAIAKVCFNLLYGYNLQPRYVALMKTPRHARIIQSGLDQNAYWIFEKYVMYPEPFTHPRVQVVCRSVQVNSVFLSSDYFPPELSHMETQLSRKFRHWRRSLVTQASWYIDSQTHPDYANISRWIYSYEF
jgi:hypothetical protein